MVLELAKEGCAEGTVAVAELQTKGRGRQGRTWASSAGKSLTFSLLLRPRLSAGELPMITLAAAVAVARTLESFRLKPRIKWPNDILMGGKKICGILTEMGPGKDRILSMVLGIGINVNQGSGDLPRELRGISTSLYRVSGRKIDRERLLGKLLLDLEETYRWVMEKRLSKLLGEWRKRALPMGAQVKVTQGRHVFYGQTLDLDEKGSLLVRTDSGIVERVISGDVETLRIKSTRRAR